VGGVKQMAVRTRQILGLRLGPKVFNARFWFSHLPGPIRVLIGNQREPPQGGQEGFQRDTRNTP